MFKLPLYQSDWTEGQNKQNSGNYCVRLLLRFFKKEEKCKINYWYFRKIIMYIYMYQISECEFSILQYSNIRIIRIHKKPEFTVVTVNEHFYSK